MTTPSDTPAARDITAASSPTTAHLVVIEVSGIQRYIFAGNMQRENVGASHLVWATTASWLPKVITDLQDHHGPKAAYLVMAVSGVGIVQTDSAEVGREVVTQLTLRALREAPGLDLKGVVVPLAVDGEPHDSASAIERGFRLLAQRRAALPGPAHRFPRLPVVRDCATSGFPAAELDRDDAGKREHPTPRSRVAVAKRRARGPAYSRLQNLVPEARRTIIAHDNRAIEGTGERRAAWLGHIHADANGLGSVLQRLGSSRDAAALVTLRRFSRAVDAVARRALSQALVAVHTSRPLDEGSVLPLIVGGDDLTLICDGRRAPELAVAYLRAFARAGDELLDTHGSAWTRWGLPEGELREDDVTAFREAIGKSRLAACAGVAIVKAHFPFHTANHLAEELTSAAKAACRTFTSYDPTVSAVDLHVLRDTTVSDLDAIRERLTTRVADGTVGSRLWGGPYLVGHGSASTALRTWEQLCVAGDQVSRGGPRGPAPLSRRQAHALREALLRGPAAADAAAARLRARHQTAAAVLATGDPKAMNATSLFGEADRATLALDALELAPFLPPPPGGTT